MGQAAAKQSAAPAPPPILPMPPRGGNAGTPIPMPPMPQATAATPPMPVSAQPQPAASAIPWKVKQQPDGSSVNYLPSPDGDPTKDIILNVNLPPKVPKAFQGQQQQPGLR